jgi:hypothetical protein
MGFAVMDFAGTDLTTRYVDEHGYVGYPRASSRGHERECPADILFAIGSTVCWVRAVR